MKKCIRCGCFNSDKRTVCADCGQHLGDAINIGDAELEAIMAEAAEKSDPFTFKTRHKVVFILSLLLIAADIVLAFFSSITPIAAFISVLCGAACAAVSGFPKILWKIYKFFLSFSVYGKMEPSESWFICREISVFGYFSVGLIAFLYGLLNNGV